MQAEAEESNVKVIVVVDIEALRRGEVEAGETCEIRGVGPVSVAAARELLGDAALAIVIKDGVDVMNVTHLNGRPPPINGPCSSSGGSGARSWAVTPPISSTCITCSSSPEVITRGSTSCGCRASTTTAKNTRLETHRRPTPKPRSGLTDPMNNELPLSA